MQHTNLDKILIASSWVIKAPLKL